MSNAKVIHWRTENQWVYSKQQHVFEFTLYDTYLLSLSHPQSHEHRAIALKGSPTKEISAEIKAYVRQGWSGKLVTCQRAGLDEWLQLLPEDTRVVRLKGPHKVLFYSETGRLRVAPCDKSELVPPEAMNVNHGNQDQPLKVLLVDDSPTIIKVLRHIFSSSPEFEVVASTEHPLEVDALMKKHTPDVVTLDIHMPELDGVSLLKQLNRKYRFRAVMISSLGLEDGTMVLDALEAGAVDYIQKPSFANLKEVGPVILSKVKAAAYARLESHTEEPLLVSGLKKIENHEDFILAIGSSTGGTQALKRLFTALPKDIPATLIVQHIPAHFSKAFADRLNELCPFEVKEAEDGDQVIPNRALIAPGGFQMEVVEKASGLSVVIKDTPPVNRHKPSVDTLFWSLKPVKSKPIMALILTGMGRDGAKGLLDLKNLGAHTVAQNQESCVVYGMPKAAVEIGAANESCHLDEMPQKISAFSRQLHTHKKVS